MATAIKISRISVVKAVNKHTATLFFFHGSGGSGDDIKEWVDILNRQELTFPHIKIIYPTAPNQPYTPLDGEMSTVWFNRSGISINAPDEKESINLICQKVMEMIEKEVANGISYNRIVVGGFSMGGALAMHLAYRFKKSLAGCFIMSSFLNKNSLVYEDLKINGSQNTPPLLQFHGLNDELVPMKWCEETHNTLKNLGVKIDFLTLKDTEHELIRPEIQKLKEWISEILPEKA